MEIRDISPEVGRLVADVPLPRMFRARQKFPGGGIESSKIYDEVRTRLKDLKSAEWQTMPQTTPPCRPITA